MMLQDILSLIQNYDIAWLRMINRAHHSILDIFFTLATDRLCWIPCCIILYPFIKRHLGYRAILLFILTILLSDQISATLLKPLVTRYRPCYVLEDLHLVGSHIGLYGFPSSHASNTFAFAMLFQKLFRARCKGIYRFFIWILALIVSYGRIYGGLHYPLDIVGGALLGSSIGWCTYKIFTI